MKKKAAKGAGGKLVRSEIIQARLSPKLRFMAELISRAERRTLSSLIEMLIDDVAQNYRVSKFENAYEDAKACTMSDAATQIWHTEEPIRLVNLALAIPGLLTHEEEKIWHLIYDTPYFWKCMKVSLCDENNNEIGTEWQPLYSLDGLIRENLYEYWDQLKAGKLNRNDLPSHKKIGKKLVSTSAEPIKKKIINNQPTVHPKMNEKEREAWLDAAMDRIEQYEEMHDRKDQGRLSKKQMQTILDQMIKNHKDKD